MTTLGSLTEPVFGRKTENGFFNFIYIISFIVAILSPISALAKGSGVSRQLSHAKAAIVVDTSNSVLYSKNQEERLPPASTTKLITAMVVLDHLSPDAIVKVSQEAARVHSVHPRLRAHEEMTVSNLLHLALMKSVNSAASALAEGVAGSEDEFVILMNRKAEAIGTTNTRFANASGLPEGTQFTTVYDLTLIMNDALKYPLIREILAKKVCSIVTPGGRTLLLRNTNKLLWADDNMIGGKTGYTDNAMHCFVGAYNTDGGQILTAVLGTSSRRWLWKCTKLLCSMGAGSQHVASARNDGLPTSIREVKTGEAVRYKKKHLNRRPSPLKKATAPLNLASNHRTAKNVIE